MKAFALPILLVAALALSACAPAAAPAAPAAPAATEAAAAEAPTEAAAEASAEATAAPMEEAALDIVDTAVGAGTGAHGQFGHRCATGLRGIADLLFGDAIADADVHRTTRKIEDAI